MHIPTLNDLKRSLDISEQIEKLQNELASVLGGLSEAVAPKGKRGRKAHAAPAAPKATKARRKMSAAGRARIIAAQKARWAKVKGADAADSVKKTAKKTVAKAKEVVSGGEVSAPAAKSAKPAKKKAARKTSKK